MSAPPQMRRSRDVSSETKLMDLFAKHNHLASAFDRIYGDDKPISVYFPDWQVLHLLGQENGLTNDQLDELHAQYSNMTAAAAAAAVGGKRKSTKRRTKRSGKRKRNRRKTLRKRSKKRKTRRT